MEKRSGTLILEENVVTKEQAQASLAQKSKEKQVSEEEFKRLQGQFEIGDILNQITIRKEAFILARNSKIEKEYTFDQKLGSGTFGEVYRVYHKITGDMRAVKRIPKNKIVRYDQFYNEVISLKTLDHQNIVKLFEIYESEQDVFLVQEMCEGGELFDMIIKKESLSEQEAANIFNQMLNSIIYCHTNAICHRDLKPENFMFESAEPDAKLKLIDFGLSRSFYKIEQSGFGKVIKMKTKAGTAFFMAPEVIRGEYTTTCDIWSIGVVLYIMISGFPPFFGNNEHEILDNILALNYDFEDEVWKNVSEDCKDLIKNLLVPENERLTTDQIKAHPWLKTFLNSEEKGYKIPKEMLDRLYNFQFHKNLKKTVLAYMASRAKDVEIKQQAQVFEKMDSDNNGYINFEELKQGFNGSLSEEELKTLLKSIDIDHNGAINYIEFIAATLDKDVYQDPQKIKDAFSILDKDSDGMIDAKELQNVLQGDNGEMMNTEVFQKALDEVDMNGDGKISYKEFERMLSVYGDTCTESNDADQDDL